MNTRRVRDGGGFEDGLPDYVMWKRKQQFQEQALRVTGEEYRCTFTLKSLFKSVVKYFVNIVKYG